MKVFDGKRWIFQTVGTIGTIINNQRDLLNVIFNKFRIFLGRRTDIRIVKYLYDGMESSDKHNELKRQLKLHIYNQTKNPRSSIFDESALFDSDHKIWDSLSKSFTWKEVVFYINKLESINTDFSLNLSKIKDHIQDYLESHPEEVSLFDLLISRIEVLAREYHVDLPACSSSESDEIENHHVLVEISSNKKVANKMLKRQINPDKYKRKEKEKNEKALKKDSAIKRDDHKNMAKKVNYHGSRKIGTSYISDDDFETD